MTDPNSSHGMFAAPQQEKPSRLPWIIAAGVVLVIIGILVYVGYSQKSNVPGANAALSPYASKLVISGVQLSQATTMIGGQSTYIDGTIVNHGDKTVTGITVQAIFDDFNNQPAQLATVQMQRIRTRQPYVDTEVFSADPIGPGQSAPFRLILDHVTDEWNSSPPTLRIVQVDFK